MYKSSSCVCSYFPPSISFGCILFSEKERSKHFNYFCIGDAPDPRSPVFVVHCSVLFLPLFRYLRKNKKAFPPILRGIGENFLIHCEDFEYPCIKITSNSLQFCSKNGICNFKVFCWKTQFYTPKSIRNDKKIIQLFN